MIRITIPAKAMGKIPIDKLPAVMEWLNGIEKEINKNIEDAIPKFSYASLFGIPYLINKEGLVEFHHDLHKDLHHKESEISDDLKDLWRAISK